MIYLEYLHRFTAHKSMACKVQVYNKQRHVAAMYCSKVAGRATGDLDSVVLYFDLVYNQK